MKIKVDEEGKKVVVNLIDAALKYGGISAFNSASTALSAMGVAEVPNDSPKVPEEPVKPRKRKRQPIKKKD